MFTPGSKIFMGSQKILKNSGIGRLRYALSKSAHFSFWLEPYIHFFLFLKKKSCFFRGKRAFSSKNASFWGRQNLPQNTPKLTILGFKNGTKSLLLAEIELRRCFCVAHIPGYQNNTLETILLAAVGRFFEKLQK